MRMAMSTGVVQSTYLNPNNNRIELEGDLVRVLHALQDAPSGGQLIMDGATFAGDALPCFQSCMTACCQSPRGRPSLLWECFCSQQAAQLGGPCGGERHEQAARALCAPLAALMRLSQWHMPHAMCRPHRLPPSLLQ